MSVFLEVERGERVFFFFFLVPADYLDDGRKNGQRWPKEYKINEYAVLR